MKQAATQAVEQSRKKQTHIRRVERRFSAMRSLEEALVSLIQAHT